MISPVTVYFNGTPAATVRSHINDMFNLSLEISLSGYLWN